MHQPTTRDPAVKEVHITPAEHEDLRVDGESVHTTRCWCVPVKVELHHGLFTHQRVFFHRLLSECEGNTDGS